MLCPTPPLACLFPSSARETRSSAKEVPFHAASEEDRAVRADIAAAFQVGGLLTLGEVTQAMLLASSCRLLSTFYLALPSLSTSLPEDLPHVVSAL